MRMTLQEWSYLVLLVAKADGLEGWDFVEAAQRWDLTAAYERGMTPIAAYEAMSEALS